MNGERPGCASREQPPTRGWYAKTHRRRQEILAAALEVFAVHGYHAGSLKLISERVGLTEAGILHHFPTKHALLLATLEYRDVHTRATVDEARKRVVDPLDAIVDAFGRNSAMPGAMRMFAVAALEASGPEHAASDYFADRTRRVKADLAAIFVALQRDGRLRGDVEPEHAAAMTMAMMDGLQLQWLQTPDSVDMCAELRCFFGYLTVGGTPSTTGQQQGFVPGSPRSGP